MDAGKRFSSLSEQTKRVWGSREHFNVFGVQRAGMVYDESLEEGLGLISVLLYTLLNWFLTLPFKFLLYIASLQSELNVRR